MGLPIGLADLEKHSTNIQLCRDRTSIHVRAAAWSTLSRPALGYEIEPDNEVAYSRVRFQTSEMLFGLEREGPSLGISQQPFTWICLVSMVLVSL